MSTLVVAAVTLTACAASQPPYYQTAAFSLEVNQIVADCNAKFATELERGECAVEPTRAAFARAGYPHLDLLDLTLAYYVALARRFDAGEITEQDMKLKMAELSVRVNNEVQRRAALQQQSAALQQQVDSQWLQSYGAFLQGLAVWSQSLQPISQPTMNPRLPITCYRVGNRMTCY